MVVKLRNNESGGSSSSSVISGGSNNRILLPVLVICIAFVTFRTIPDAQWILHNNSELELDDSVIGGGDGYGYGHGNKQQKQLQQQVDDKQTIIDEFQKINDRLLGPDRYGDPNEYNDECGVTTDCPQFYTIEDIQRSVQYMDDHSDVLEEWSQTEMKRKTQHAKKGCHTNGTHVLDNGGWCLEPQNISTATASTAAAIQYKINETHSYPMAQHHVGESKNIASVIVELISTENITSISDYGAGIGQYKHFVLNTDGSTTVTATTTTTTGTTTTVTNNTSNRRPTIAYYAYDGAGNIEEYTHGFVQHFDFTFPQALPKTDFVISLEVGEHVPSKFEGMLFRNIHRHNCKGVILSWAILGQGGNSHINCHSNDYVINIMDQLGYVEDLDLKRKLRSKKDNYWWFFQSSMAFRRKEIPDGCPR